MASRAEPATDQRAALVAPQAPVPWGSIARHGILITTCAIILFPLVWVLLLSVKSLPDAYTNRIWPRTFDFSSYSQALTSIDTLPQNLRNSIVVTLATMLITTTIAVLAGYALVHLPDTCEGARARDPRRLALRAEPRDRPHLDLGDPGAARADQLDLGPDPPLPDARARGERLHHARGLRDDPEGARRVGPGRRRRARS